MGTKEAWLAGLVDGEGCFTLSISVQHKKSLHISPRFSISMKQGEWAKRVAEILNLHGIPFHQRTRKNQYEITVSSGTAVRKLIDILLPYLVVKKRLAQRLTKFPMAPPRNRFTPIDRVYLDEICELVDFVRAFNKGKNRRHRWDGKTIRAYFG